MLLKTERLLWPQSEGRWALASYTEDFLPILFVLFVYLRVLQEFCPPRWLSLPSLAHSALRLRSSKYHFVHATTMPRPGLSWSLRIVVST
ncbi:hypothetical protein L226DRAFT_98834 [Lentinus tigrinus ALCF2SS1-7]|uniref:uncharacterized protein n=1 Tax=Lentinus tigrinus ALCF2SS1-7 TaxID=1328758 RepID=UPI0011662B55|nr:hypothetical protein L226DRAFT_98834 [Lentinus tigrinus ALCF2SS1-7]